ncbi:MAG: chloride channel protein, partial [Peptococcaceae bacterium]|nr:chloride channel protein [Peptococcaceae bacterium]
MKESINKALVSTKEYTLAFVRWLLLGITVGAVCGLVGTAFAKSVSFVTELREAHGWLILLLPLGGLASVGIYKLCRVTDVGTNQVLKSVRSEKTVPFLLAPAVFIGSVLTHLFGGSAGREGAALQLGGSISALLSSMFRLDEKSRHVLTMCGMGAVFSALFGTPLGACVFALEVVSVGQVCSAALFPCIVSSITAFSIANLLGVEPERFPLSFVPKLSVSSMWQVLVIAIIGALVSILFCYALHYTEKLFRKLFKNPFLRIAVGGTAIVLLTIIVGNDDYNGGGIHVINRIITENQVNYEAFILKIIFTAITVAAGYKGGEIIPTMFIGGTLGGSLALLLGLNPGFGAAVGIAALFCGVTNCPLATIILSIEMFGAEGAVFFALAAITSFLLSGKASLYSGQKFLFSKLREESSETPEKAEDAPETS